MENHILVQSCCMAMTADCLACSDDISVKEYCKIHPSTVGCENGNTLYEGHLAHSIV